MVWGHTNDVDDLSITCVDNMAELEGIGRESPPACRSDSSAPKPKPGPEPNESNFDALLKKSVELMEQFLKQQLAELNDLKQAGDEQELEETLEGLKQLFTETSEGERMILTDHVAALKGALEMFYTFADVLLKAVLDDQEAYRGSYSYSLSNLTSWTDESMCLCHKINATGLLLTHVRHLQILTERGDCDDFTKDAVMLNLLVIYNCAKDHNFPPYYYHQVKWASLLTPWMNSAHACIRMQSKFLLGYLRPALDDNLHVLLEISENDWKILVGMLEDACEPPEFTATLIRVPASLIQQSFDIASMLQGFTPSVEAAPSVPIEFTAKGLFPKADLEMALHNVSISDNQMSTTFAVEIEEDNGYKMSAVEIVNALENLLSTSSNRQAFTNYPFLPLLITLLTLGEAKEKVAACRVLWCLVDTAQIKEAMKVPDSSLAKTLEELRSSEHSEVQTLRRCIEISFERAQYKESQQSLTATAINEREQDPNKDLDLELQLFYIETCYRYAKYSECVFWSHQVLNHVKVAKVYKGMALYHIYRQEQMHLQEKQDTLPPREFHSEHASCYSKAKEVIGLLGYALDEGLISPDGEGSKMLDTAMVDYMYETNNLKAMKRCFLCRKKQGKKSSVANTIGKSNQCEITMQAEDNPHSNNTSHEKEKRVDDEALAHTVCDQEAAYKILKEGSTVQEQTQPDIPMCGEVTSSKALYDQSLPEECETRKKANKQPQTVVAENPCTEKYQKQKKSDKVHKSHSSAIEKNTQSGKLQAKPPKTKPKQQGLQASHLFPEAIIRRFATAVPHAVGAKVCEFGVSGTVQHKKKGALQSPGECTFFMLCHECEEMLSVDESWFLRKFFNQIYDESHPSRPKEEQSIPYGKEFFQFCIGLIFRLLHWDDSVCLNADEVYRLLIKCRAILMNGDASLESKPEVFLLMSPRFVEEEQYGAMNRFLAGMCSSIFGMHNLHTSLLELRMDKPMFAHFFLVHIGVMNLLVKFCPSAEYLIPEKFCISSDGGIYSTPEDSIRKKFLPQGVWTSFQVRAMRMERQSLEGPSLSYEPIKPPEEHAAELFGILKAEAYDERTLSTKGVTPVTKEFPRIISFLPPAFKIRQDSTPLVLPKGHRILLHHAHGGRENGGIVFLAVGEGGGYSINNPYVAIYIYKPGLITAYGFFVSADELKPIGSLLDEKGRPVIQNHEELLTVYQGYVIPTLQCGLQEKGFYSLKSLISRLGAIGYLPLVDAQCTPCTTEDVDISRCLYCHNRCDYCFKETPAMGISLKGPEEVDMDFKFCSFECQRYSTEPPSSTDSEIFLITPKKQLLSITESTKTPKYFKPCCAPISQDDQKLLHIFACGMSWTGYLREDEIVLCLGSFPEKRMYAVHRGRSLTGQLCLEFFVSQELAPEEPLPYIEGKDAMEALETLKEDEIIQPCLQQAVATISSMTGFEINLTLADMCATLPLALEEIFNGKSDTTKGETMGSSNATYSGRETKEVLHITKEGHPSSDQELRQPLEIEAERSMNIPVMEILECPNKATCIPIQHTLLSDTDATKLPVLQEDKGSIPSKSTSHQETDAHALLSVFEDN